MCEVKINLYLNKQINMFYKLISIIIGINLSGSFFYRNTINIFFCREYCPSLTRNTLFLILRKYVKIYLILDS